MAKRGHATLANLIVNLTKQTADLQRSVERGIGSRVAKAVRKPKTRRRKGQ